MLSILIIPHYVIWHYNSALLNFARIWWNFETFLYNFFSISELLKTLFSGWRRIKEKNPKGFEPSVFIENTFVNIIVIIFGLIVRLLVILIGICVLFINLILGSLLFILWVTIPLIIIELMRRGIYLLAI